jgi:hypothetical protein
MVGYKGKYKGIEARQMRVILILLFPAVLIWLTCLHSLNLSFFTCDGWVKQLSSQFV